LARGPWGAQGNLSAGVTEHKDVRRQGAKCHSYHQECDPSGGHGLHDAIPSDLAQAEYLVQLQFKGVT
jgi:hypothetical protein